MSPLVDSSSDEDVPLAVKKAQFRGRWIYAIVLYHVRDGSCNNGFHLSNSVGWPCEDCSFSSRPKGLLLACAWPMRAVGQP